MLIFDPAVIPKLVVSDPVTVVELPLGAIVKFPPELTSNVALFAALPSESLYVSCKHAPVAEFTSNDLSGELVPTPSLADALEFRIAVDPNVQDPDVEP